MPRLKASSIIVSLTSRESRFLDVFIIRGNCSVGGVLKNLGAPRQVTAQLSGDEFAIFLYGMESRFGVKLYGKLRKNMLFKNFEKK